MTDIHIINTLYNERQTSIKYVDKHKKCILCDEQINIDDYTEHVVSCFGPENSLLPSIEQPVVYNEPIDDDLENGTSCTGPENILPDGLLPSVASNDDSALIFEPVTGADDVDATPVIINENFKKYCVLCCNRIDESEFMDHVMNCSGPSSIIPPVDNEPMIDLPKSSISTNDDQDSIIKEQMKPCIICNKQIKESEFEAHVHACLSEKPTPETTKKQTTIICFSCHRLINTEDRLSRQISCASHHTYCFSCLQNSMEEFARNSLVPLCHPTLCDYELSRYDISLIPLERRISDRLVKLAKGQQRPQCSKCHFYIDIDDYEDYYDHIDVCRELILCEYCLCPYSINQLQNHIIQCRNDKSSQNDKLINFIINKTKYSFTKEQINFFIQQKKKKNNLNLDPLSIVDALAVFGPIFPYDMPTRDCDVCMEACPYEDIYVFDCVDSHKLCYSCYYRSCETKMSNGEILTCGLCTNPLQDSELNQLRVSDEQIKIFRDYQMKKTLDAYSNLTRGIIKCPNQKCSWIAEAEDPTERFKVQCPLCKREFCSLCNQQYHYRTKCQQLPQITQQWFLWCQTERTRYLTNRAQKDAAYAARLNEYNRKLDENENRNRDLRRRYEELMNDEQYKAKNCRLCPSCKRVVQRLEGCDKMICGQDAHGGNVQSGCGTKFNWPQALPYTATGTFQPQQEIIDLPKPENPIVQHIGVKCDECQNDVNGIRFDCIHCPTLIYCENCEQQATLNHSQQMKQQSHVFRLIMKSEELSS